MSHDLLRLGVNVELEKELAVELSVLIGVGGCGWSRAANIRRISITSLQLKNTPAVSVSAAEDITWRSRWHSMWIGPLFLGFGVVLGL